jgi:hypothetical protein
VTVEELVLAVIDALETIPIPYMVVGSFSSSYYGIGRSTRDADFVIELGDQSLARVADHLGPRFRFDPQMSFETITGTIRNIIHVADPLFQIELFRLSDDSHDQERFRRRQRAKLFDRDTFLPTAEDVIVTKLRWTVEGKRTRDWEDVRGVIAVQGDRIDWEYVHRWCDQHGTRTTLDEIRRSIPPI